MLPDIDVCADLPRIFHLFDCPDFSTNPGARAETSESLYHLVFATLSFVPFDAMAVSPPIFPPISPIPDACAETSVSLYCPVFSTLSFDCRLGGWREMGTMEEGIEEAILGVFRLG